jgi:predicted PurR-regulated permease PerM
MNSGLKFPFYAKASLVFIGLFAFISTLFIAREIIVPIIYSIIIAIVLSPMVSFLERKKITRIVAISIVLTLLILITVLFIILLSTQILQFTDSFPKLIKEFHKMVAEIVVWISENSNFSISKINTWIAQKNQDIINNFSSMIGQTIIGTGSALVVLVLIPVYVFILSTSFN